MVPYTKLRDISALFPSKRDLMLTDEDAIFIRAALGLSDSLNIISPFTRSYETRTFHSRAV